MNEPTDSQLLRDYAQMRSEPAFARLVRRHVDFVYSAALRMIRDAHLAEDVTQGVFVALANNAGQLADRPVLAGWLHRTAQNIAAQTVRTEVRRRNREQEAAAMNQLFSEDAAVPWEQIAPHLDAALGELNESERDSLLLRYFEKKSAREMAQILHISEEAAQKRVSRAVDQLRDFFAKRGATIAAGALVTVVSANAVQAAPVGLAAAIVTSAFASTAAVSTALATTTKAVTMTTLQKVTVAGALAAALGFAVVEAQKYSSAKSRLEALQQTQRDLAQSMESDKTNYQQQLADLQAENSRLNKNSTELLRLRNEVGKLRKDATNNNNSVAAKTPSPDSSDSPAFQTFSATNRFNFPWGQTAIAGGWTIPSGDKVLVFATPSPIEDGTQLNVKIKIAQISPENQKSVWKDLQAPDGLTSLAMQLPQADAEALLNKLFQSQSGISTVREMQITTASGRPAEIQSGASESDAGSINLIPVISTDGKTVDLQMTSRLNFPR